MASRGINKVILVGNLGADPEIRYTQNSIAIANLSVATSETWKDKQTGEQRENTEWHRLVCYRRLAEIAGEYLRKGSKVYIEGKLQTRKWQGQDGKDNYTTEIIVNDLQMLDGRNQSNQQGGQQQAPAPQQQAPQQNVQGQGQQGGQQQAPQQQGFQNQGQQAPQQGGQQQAPAPQQAPQQQGGQRPNPTPVNNPDFDDDIPF